MFSNPYYHQTTKRVVETFGNLFNNINIVREDRSGVEQNRIKVPLAYHAKKAWHRVLKEYTDANEEVTTLQGYFPRMSFDVADMTPMKDKQTTSPKFIYREDGAGGMTKTTMRTKMRLTFELTVVTKKQEDMFKIIEQIIPNFTPSISVSLKSSRLLGDNAIDDLTFTFDDLSKDDELEMTLQEGYDLQVYVRSLTFNVDVVYYGPTESASGIIKTADVVFIDGNTGKGMSKVQVQVDPMDAEASSFGTSCGVFLLDDDFQIITSASLGTTTGLLE